MGAWGYEALESDEGLDVIDLLKENIPDNLEYKLSDIISLMKGNLLGDTMEDIDFLYDNTAIAIAELYFMFKDEGKLRYADDEDDGKSLKKIKAFTADENSLKYILKYLTDIRDEVPDIDGEREIVELWRDSDVYEKWNKHLNRLIERINEEIDETCCNRR